MPTTVRSHAKINLGLHIGAPRADGFHGLATVYQTLEVHDRLTVAARDATATKIRITSNDSRVPTDGRNTAWKMAELALQRVKRTAEVEIHIEKRLPVQGGMGAGSANAVAALVGLGAELGFGDWGGGIPGAQKRGTWGTQWDEVQGTRRDEGGGIPGAQKRGTWGTQWDEVQGTRWDETQDPQPDSIKRAQTTWAARAWMEIAAKVGSDVPLFLIGGTILGVDRGQEVYPLKDIEPVWCVIATPDIGVSTPQAFRDWDALCAAEGLTQEASAAKLKELSRAYVSAFSGGFPEGRHAGSSGVLSMGENLAGPQESALVRTGISRWIQNDFERVVFPQHPSLAEIKRILAAPGTPEAAQACPCLLASLSGSGSALFGLYRIREHADATCQRLHAAGVKSLLTRTLPRAKYWREMLTQQEH